MKAIIFDLDGTVIWHNEATEFCVDAIMKCKAAGYIIGIATARSHITAGQFIDTFNADFIVASGGALIRINEYPVIRHVIPKIELMNILGSIQRIDSDYKIIIESESMLYCNFDECLNWPGYQNAALFNRTSLESQNTEALKIIIPYSEAMAFLFDDYEIASRYNITLYNKRNWLRITKKDVSKYNGVVKALSVLGLSPNDVLYFGDDDDDLELLKSCSLGIAVGNAEDEIKKNADIICGRVDEDGVAHWLKTNLIV